MWNQDEMGNPQGVKVLSLEIPLTRHTCNDLDLNINSPLCNDAEICIKFLSVHLMN